MTCFIASEFTQNFQSSRICYKKGSEVLIYNEQQQLDQYNHQRHGNDRTCKSEQFSRQEESDRETTHHFSAVQY